MNKLIAKLRSFFRKGSFAAGVAVIAGGTAAGQAVVFLASPVLTRLYMPEDFGHLAAYSSLVSLIVVVASLRYQLAIPLPENDEDAFSLLVISLVALVVVTVLLTLLLWGFGRGLFQLLGTKRLIPYFWLVPLGILGAGAYQAFSYWAIRKNSHNILGITKLTQGLGLVVTQILLGILKLGPVGLLAGDVVGRVAGTSNLIRLSASQRPKSRLTFESIKRNALRYRRFPLLSSGSALLNSAGLQLPSLILVSLLGPRVAGWYALSQRLIGIPMTLLGLSVSQVYAGKAAQLKREAPSELPALFFQTGKRLFLIAIAPSVIFLVFGPWIFKTVFGSEWREAGEYTRILAPMFLFQFTVTPISQTLNVLERQDLQLIWDIARLLLVIGAFGLTKFLQWSAAQAILGQSIAMTIAYFGLIGLNWATLRQLKRR